MLRVKNNKFEFQVESIDCSFSWEMIEIRRILQPDPYGVLVEVMIPCWLGERAEPLTTLDSPLIYNLSFTFDQILAWNLRFPHFVS